MPVDQSMGTGIAHECRFEHRMGMGLNECSLKKIWGRDWKRVQVDQSMGMGIAHECRLNTERGRESALRR